jgi:hypothetical protein
MERPKLNMSHKTVYVTRFLFNELLGAKQIELKTFTIIYKIIHFHALWNKRKCLMNVKHETSF